MFRSANVNVNRHQPISGFSAECFPLIGWIGEAQKVPGAIDKCVHRVRLSASGTATTRSGKGNREERDYTGTKLDLLFPVSASAKKGNNIN